MDRVPPSDLLATLPAFPNVTMQAATERSEQNERRDPPSAKLSLRYWLRYGDGPILLLLILLPLLIRLPEFAGAVHANAIGYTGALGSTVPGFIGGQPTIDPNIGFTSQALGAQAAQQWAHGQIPWWNPFEGVGMPLAGEMQSAAFFPPTLLLLWPWGQTAFHICLQIIAGIATYYLLRQMGFSRMAALTGGVLFEFNGVFGWLANAVVNPIPFLPLLLLGIERAFRRADQEATPPTRRRWSVGDLTSGWKWIAAALGLSLLAGFPEVAFIDGLLSAIWFAVRICMLQNWNARMRFAVKSGVGVVIGVAIALPPLIAFADYLPVAYIAEHSQAFASPLTNVALAQYFQPYVFGNIFQYNSHVDIFNSWGSIGGYLGATLAFLALLGIFGRRLLGLRLVLAGWIVLCIGQSVNMQPFAFIVSKIPLMGSVVFYRYSNASWVMAAIVLCAFAIDDWRGSTVDKLKITLCAAFTLAVLSLGTLWLAAPQLTALLHDPTYLKKYLVGSVGIEWVAILFLLIAAFYGLDAAPGAAQVRAPDSEEVSSFARILRTRPHAVLMSLTVMALTIGYFTLPTLANPRSVSIDDAGVQYLKAHVGYGRFYSLGPFWPNYGSYYDVASINHNDLPVSQVWVSYINAHLDPYMNPELFLSLPRTPPQPSATDEFVAHLANFEGVGVNYVITSPEQKPFTKVPAKERPVLVYQDSLMWIYQLPAPAPLFSAKENVCQVQTDSWTHATATCSAPATLIYRSLTDSGWHASVNGHEVQITPYQSLFQTVQVPAGGAQVTFWYEPKYGRLALLVAGLALVGLFCAGVVSFLAERRLRLI